jgi:hypothetical protein
LNEFHCIASVSDWYADRVVGPEAIARMMVSAMVVEDDRGSIQSALECVSHTRTHPIHNGEFAVHVRAKAREGSGRLLGKVDVFGKRTEAAFEMFRAQFPNALSRPWWEGFLRDIRITDDQHIVSRKEGDGRYEIRVNGLRAGLVLGGEGRWFAEWSRGHLGQAGSLRDAALLVGAHARAGMRH